MTILVCPICFDSRKLDKGTAKSQARTIAASIDGEAVGGHGEVEVVPHAVHSEASGDS